MKSPMKLMPSLLVGLALLFLSPSLVWAEQYRPEIQRALEALIAGDEAGFLSHIEPLVDRGDVEARIIKGRYFSRKGLFADAITLLKPLAEQGNADAQYHLAGAYFLQSPEDSQEALRWLDAAVSQQHRKAIILRRSLANAPVSPDGTFTLVELVPYIKGILSEKVASMSEPKLACYKTPRSLLVSSYEMAVDECTVELREQHGERFQFDQQQAVASTLATCANDKVFAKVDVTRKSLAECLGK